MNLSQQQQQAINAMLHFVFEAKEEVFILRGGAGSGKTTLITKLINELNDKGVECSVMAPTGRAARILTNKLKCSIALGAYTIHSTIYAKDKQKTLSANDHKEYFSIKEKDNSSRLYIVDEASMLGDNAHNDYDVSFGTGRLLNDLFAHLTLNSDKTPTKVLFVGDDTQLLPVHEEFSPAMSAEYLSKHYRKKVVEFELNEVFRQQEQSSILKNALLIRHSILNDIQLPVRIQNDVNVVNLKNGEFIKNAAQSIIERKNSIVIASTNKKTFHYNQQIRSLLFKHTDQLHVGDQLLNYRNNRKHSIMNGDIFTVTELSGDIEHQDVHIKNKSTVRLYFRKIKVCVNHDLEQQPIEVMILENLLYNDASKLSSDEYQALQIHFNQRYSKEKYSKEEYQKKKEQDEYLNALQVKYGYAITCHKAQGGEWDQVYVELNHLYKYGIINILRWNYTALTRASKQLFIRS